MADWLAGFEILLYFFPGLLAGLLVRRFRPSLVGRVEAVANKLLGITLYIILFSMGWRLAGDPVIHKSLANLGLQALLFAFLTTLFSILFALILRPRRQLSRHGQRAREGAVGKSGAWLQRLRGPAIMTGVVILGAAAALAWPFFSPLPSPDPGVFTTWVLKVMVASVGVGLGCADTAALRSIRDWRFLLLPFVTAVASILGGILAALPAGLPWNHGAAVGGGFGWYSLSAILIGNSGNQALAAVAFMANLFRESMAILAIGLLQALGRPSAGIAAAGATSMDVCLPLLALWDEGAQTAPAVWHGMALSLLVPLVVPLFLAL